MLMSEINLKEVITEESNNFIKSYLNNDCVMLGVEVMPDDEDKYYLIYRRYTNQIDKTHVLALPKKGKSGKPCYMGNLFWFVITAGYRYIKEQPRYTIDNKHIVIPEWLQFKNLAKWCLFQSYCKKLFNHYE